MLSVEPNTRAPSNSHCMISLCIKIEAEKPLNILILGAKHICTFLQTQDYYRIEFIFKEDTFLLVFFFFLNIYFIFKKIQVKIFHSIILKEQTAQSVNNFIKFCFSCKMSILGSTLHREKPTKNCLLAPQVDSLSLLVFPYGRLINELIMDLLNIYLLSFYYVFSWTDRVQNTGVRRLVHVVIWMSEERALFLLTEPQSPPPTTHTLETLSGMCQWEVIFWQSFDSLLYLCKVSLWGRKYFLLPSQIL